MVQDRGGEAVANRLAQGFRSRGYPTDNLGVYASLRFTTNGDFDILFPARPSVAPAMWRVFQARSQAAAGGRPAAWISTAIATTDHRCAGGTGGGVVNASRSHIALGYFVKGSSRDTARACWASIASGVRGDPRTRWPTGCPAIPEAQLGHPQFGDGFWRRRRRRRRVNRTASAEDTRAASMWAAQRKKNNTIRYTRGDILTGVGSRRDGPLKTESNASRALCDRVRMLGRVGMTRLPDVYARRCLRLPVALRGPARWRCSKAATTVCPFSRRRSRNVDRRRRRVLLDITELGRLDRLDAAEPEGSLVQGSGRAKLGHAMSVPTPKWSRRICGDDMSRVSGPSARAETRKRLGNAGGSSRASYTELASNGDGNSSSPTRRKTSVRCSSGWCRWQLFVGPYRRSARLTRVQRVVGRGEERIQRYCARG